MKKKANFDIKTILLQEYDKRKKKNPYFSKRAYAKLLGIDQSSLSKFFKGERTFSRETIERCLKHLKLDDSVKSIIEENIQFRNSAFLVPEESILKVLSHWKYWAILEYIKIDNTYSPDEIARRLNLKEEDVKTCLHDLSELHFVKILNDKIKLLKPNNNWIANEKTSIARRLLQMNLLKLSLTALETIPIDRREHGSLTVAIDEKKLPDIKAKIRKFQQELGKYCQREGNLDEVYQLTISFFPITTDD